MRGGVSYTFLVNLGMQLPFPFRTYELPSISFHSYMSYAFSQLATVSLKGEVDLHRHAQNYFQPNFHLCPFLAVS